MFGLSRFRDVLIGCMHCQIRVVQLVVSILLFEVQLCYVDWLAVELNIVFLFQGVIE
jgi:hypothetical protein